MRRESGATNCMVLSGGRRWGLAVAARTEKWMDGKRDREEGTELFLFKSPRGRFGTVMMGYGRCVGGVVVLLPPPDVPTPNSSFALSSHLHTHSWEICKLAL